MALISNAKGRRVNETPSGYERLFGNRDLGMLMSKVQSAVISTGNELEQVLASKITDSKNISIGNINPEKRIFKKIKDGHDIKVDCVIIQKEKIIIVEIKDGDTFDTKKVAGEIQSLLAVKEYLKKEQKIKEENILLYYCSFNATSHEQIEKGAKGLLQKGFALTGKEFCNLINLNFEMIVQEREKDQKENLKYFLKEVEKIPDNSLNLKK